MISGESLEAPQHEQAGAARPDRAAAWRRLMWRMALGLSAANLCGGATVFLFLAFVVPTPAEVEFDWELLRLNLAVFVPLGLVATVVANARGLQLAEPVRGWFEAGRAPTARERELTLRQPLDQAKLAGLLWVIATATFTALNAFASLRLAIIVAFTVGLGGVMTSALSYLIVERMGRVLIAGALAHGVPEEPAAPGVGTRVVLAWAVVAGIPLVGGVLLALAVLTGEGASADQIAATVLFLGLVGLLLGLIAMRATARSMAEPLEELRAAVRRVERGDLAAEVAVYDGSEIGLMQAGFNKMAAGLRERERLRDLFGRHVGPEVARRALDRGVELGGEVRDCAVLFVDVVGSTALAAARPAPEVVAVLNRFFAAVVDVVDQCGGWVNKFEGDAALCIFGAPVDRGDAASCALVAARQLDRRLREEVPELWAAIGVSAGPVVAGNVGAAERYEYTVIGDPVNEAARLSEVAKQRPGRVLASEVALAAASEAEAARWRLGEAIALRGRPSTTRTAEPVAVAEPASAS